jgi:hypothetical protein
MFLDSRPTYQAIEVHVKDIQNDMDVTLTSSVGQTWGYLQRQTAR